MTKHKSSYLKDPSELKSFATTTTSQSLATKESNELTLPSMNLLTGPACIKTSNDISPHATPAKESKPVNSPPPAYYNLSLSLPNLGKSSQWISSFNYPSPDKDTTQSWS